MKAYPKVADMASPAEVPENLTYFLEKLGMKNEKRRNVHAQRLIRVLKPRSGPMALAMPATVGLALKFDRGPKTKTNVNFLHSYGFCESYDEVMKYKWAYMRKTRGNLREENVEDSDCSAPNFSEEELEREEREDAEEEAELERGEREDAEEEAEEEAAHVEPIEEIEVLDGEITQFCADNVDLTLSSQYGNSEFHAVARIRSLDRFDRS